MAERYSTAGAICPHCEHENRASESDGGLYDEGVSEWECGDCGKTFRVDAFCQWSWTTQPKEQSNG